MPNLLIHKYFGLPYVALRQTEQQYIRMNVELKNLKTTFWTNTGTGSTNSIGGSKLRNLEFIFGNILTERAKTIETFGSENSNFTFATSYWARQLGLKSTVNLWAEDDSNLLEAKRRHEDIGASVRTLPKWSCISRSLLTQFSPAVSYCFEGRRLVPIGGASAVGCVGAATIPIEIEDHIKSGRIPYPDTIVIPVSSGGTLAGFLAGLSTTTLAVRVVGVRVSGFQNLSLLRHLSAQSRRLIHSHSRHFKHVDVSLISSVRSEKPSEHHEVSNIALEALETDSHYFDPTLRTYLAGITSSFFHSKNTLIWNTAVC